MVICLERDADLHMAQLMPLPLTVSCCSKSRLVLPFWYRPTRVVLDKGPLNVCVYTLVVFKRKPYVYMWSKTSCVLNMSKYSNCNSIRLSVEYLPLISADVASLMQ